MKSLDSLSCSEALHLCTLRICRACTLLGLASLILPWSSMLAANCRHQNSIWSDQMQACGCHEETYMDGDSHCHHEPAASRLLIWSRA